ncbi:MAG: ATP-binding cassette, sub-family er 1 [Methanolobus sp.]|jgi:ATP-binding cassette subfamily E protein 1|uniref:Putative ATPase, Rnase L inhibitor (RLI) like protein n=1 Tax=Methanolobus tindarius DSM 2278 TaxID=1090322 RepID=W9DP03_METTI|nr:ribosome biogenesis/translation initiation ATPase RLI [Methanolobus tindarius]ETA67919.1 putative ATPase, Rnase L inhibitor (RLI) like protein [Methanolobus tindarius DSM 2278]MDK2937966.1 ATP-binding cassette, sub-family er 1 [Methanolobus sp.]
MRIAILNKDRCQPRRCSHECEKYCPRVRTGDETIIFGEDGKPIISEEMCVGCGICVHKCPFEAIMIIGLPEALTEPTHRYGPNGFALYGLPIPQIGKVTGILGPNGIGKSTAVQILSGTLVPNFSEDNSNWEKVLEHYAGTALYDYFSDVVDGDIKVSQKPQYVDMIPKAFKGKTSELLDKTDERGKLPELVERLNLSHVMDRKITELSGGELQRVAIAACAAKDADFYFFDEISPYLDIYQRINTAQLIQEISEDKAVLVVEHDLAILDMLADAVHVAYGEPGGYGVITHPKGVRIAINQYLKGFLPEENVRVRPEAIKFEVHPPRVETDINTLVDYDAFSKKYGEGFGLSTDGGSLKEGEVLGIVGPNGIGKSTFVKILAGEVEPDEGKLDLDIKIAYKPQYIKADSPMQVRYFLGGLSSKFNSSYFQTEIAKPLNIERLYERMLTELSGGELQRVAIAACLCQDADMYILDEPSAHLDVEQRSMATKVIKRFAENNSKTAMVVDHDIYMIDMLSERLIVFEGEPAVYGKAHEPSSMQDGMNKFLANLDITFRRDEDTSRPRVNKKDSRLDREQKSKGEYYYHNIADE